jgi:cbb3-type cytochrome oxidase subunit 3
MNLSRIKTKEIGESLGKLVFIMAEKAFLTFLGLFVIVLIFGAIIYYHYNILAKKEEAQTIKEPLQFQEKSYQNVSRAWQERERKFEEADQKEYPSPFKIKQPEEAILKESSGSSGAKGETGLEENSNSLGTEQSEESGPEELPGSSDIDQE